MTLLATKPMCLFGRGPRTPHLALSARGRSGEIQQLREDLEFSHLMTAGWLDRPTITSGEAPEFDHTTPTTYTLTGHGFIQPGWEQARLAIDPTGANNGLDWIAVEPGEDGNNIKVEYVDGGKGATTAVDYTPATRTVTVTLDIGAGGDTANNVITALASSSTGANYVVMARNAYGSSGAGNIATTYAATNLSGGRGKALRRAALTRGTAANSQLIWVARKPGLEGNLISVTYRTGLGAGLLPVITVSGYDIDVYLRAAATTANDILRALETSDEARNLVEVFRPVNHNGTGLPGALAKANLSGGADGTAVRVTVGGYPCSVSTITDNTITFTAPTVAVYAADTVVPVVIDICGYVTTLQGVVV